MSKKMTLKNYYKNLRERRKSPQKLFLEEIARKCDVAEGTVRRWVLEEQIPRDEKHIKIIEKITGYGREELWN